MSLRLRLTLVILAVVGVMGLASLVSFRLNRGIEGLVAELDRTSSEPLDGEDLLGRALELEGRWDERGHFVAAEIERLPRSRRPKLRGPIQELDPGRSSLTIYGRRIRVTDESELTIDEAGTDLLAALEVGQRVEVSCKVEPEGQWVAREIETVGVKSSDKVKGTITRVDFSDPAGPSLWIDGLEIRVPPEVEVSYPRGPLYRMEVATRMTLAIEEALAAAQELLKQRYREKELRARGEPERAVAVDRAIEDVGERLEDAVASFAHYLSEIRSSLQEEQRPEPGLTSLEESGAAFAAGVDRFLELSGPDPDEAQVYLQEVLEPALRTQVAPGVRSHLLETEAELGFELGAIATRAASAARLAIAANIAGVVLAVAAGLVVSRPISGPMRALAAAARRIGGGDLATRVEVGAGEVGELASAFNRMAEELAASTVSVARLDNVIDSMAGALVLLDSGGRIASVNPAAADLLGYQREDLVGQPFTLICPDSQGKPLLTDAGAACEERLLRRKDGSTLPVSFSSAGLRGEPGGAAGCVCLALDLSEHKSLEGQLRRSLAEKELLLREVHHRVKNNLQVISSLLDLQSRSISDPQSLERFQESQDRIRSMVIIHDQLHRTEDLQSVDLRAYLELLVAHLAQSHVDPPGRVHLRAELEELRLDLDRALACGLIVNELVTNALKHAFAPDATGEVVVSMRSTSDGMVALEVSDNGRGFEAEPWGEESTSLGLSLVSTLARQLRGRLASNGRAGASFRVEFPLGRAREVA